MKEIFPVRKLVEKMESCPINVKTWIISFVTILAIRYFIESLLFGFKPTNFKDVVGSVFHGTFLFFLVSFVTILTIFIFLTKEKFVKVANILLWGQWLIILPPIVDKMIFKTHAYWSFYIFDSVGGLIERYFKFFGENPSFGITWGTRVEVLIAMICLGIYLGIKKKSIKWGFFGVFLFYTILYLFGVFPSLLTFLIKGLAGENIFKITNIDIASVFLPPLEIFKFEEKTIKMALHYRTSLFLGPFLFINLIILQLLISKQKLKALIGNVRYPQMFFNEGLFFIGFALGILYFPQNLKIEVFSTLGIVNLMLAILCAWFFSVLINDITDLEIDKITNTERPLVRGIFKVEEYRQYALIFALLASIFAFIVGTKTLFIISTYLLVTWVYSCDPFRLKKFIIISSVVSSAASILFLFLGFILISNGQSTIEFPWRIGIFLFIVYIFLIPIKDIKDIESDRENGVLTVPGILGEQNARLFFSIVIFISYLASVMVLNENKLWVTATIFGAISYWTLNNKKIKTRDLNYWILGLVFAYGILLVTITFF